MHHQIIQQNKFYLNKYLLIENQVQEEETMLKVYKLILCCGKLKGYLCYRTTFCNKVALDV